jgi:heme-degrading monooxygenase HmoA
MFVAMNRFKVAPGAEAEFERVWTSRDTHLRAVPGFVEFHLLRGPARDDHVLYASHTIWRTRADFEVWTRSEAFRMAHQGAGGRKPLYLEHPEFEGFEAVQTVKPAMA